LLRDAGAPTFPAYRVLVFLAPLLALVAVLVLPACTAAAPVGDLHPHRIVSLVPSLTEDLFAIGAGAAVVGVSSFTDYPPAARRLPVISSFASVDAERVVRLRPDVVVGITAQNAAAAELRKAGIRTVLLADDGFDDIFTCIDALGMLTGHVDEARAVGDRLRARTTALLHTVRPRPRRPRVFVVLGVATSFTTGDSSYIARLVRLAGGTNAAVLRDAYAPYSAEALVAAQPDILIADPTVELRGVLGRAPWNALQAVRSGRIAYLPDPAILERPGPRYNEGLAWLIATLNAVRV
jgi:iron complex transport system substrate-binding protein